MLASHEHESSLDLAVVRPTGVYLLDFVCSGILESLSLLYLSLDLDLYVLGDDAWIS